MTLPPHPHQNEEQQHPSQRIIKGLQDDALKMIGTMKADHQNDELRATVERFLRHYKYYLPEAPKGMTDKEANEWLVSYITQYGNKRELEGRKKAKQENARDFDAIVGAFNYALTQGFDKDSVQLLRMEINGADARAKYIDLPEQLTELTNNTEK